MKYTLDPDGVGKIKPRFNEHELESPVRVLPRLARVNGPAKSNLSPEVFQPTNSLSKGPTISTALLIEVS